MNRRSFLSFFTSAALAVPVSVIAAREVVVGIDLAGRLPGFASGGSFHVGCGGGIDSHIVSFKAIPMNGHITVSRNRQ